MIIYECDMCKGLKRNLDERRVVKIFHDGLREESYDICPDCCEKLVDEIENDPE